MILQVTRPPRLPEVVLAAIDPAPARWVVKGARRQRALQAPGQQLSVWEEDYRPRPEHLVPRGTANQGVFTFHRRPRDAFWRPGAWDHRQAPYVAGYGFAGHIDPRACRFVPRAGDARFEQLASEADRVVLDALLAIACRGAPADGVYLLDEVL